jgi:hypothetical protein
LARLANNALLLASDGEDLSTVDFIRIVAKYMGRNVTLIPAPELVVDVRSEAEEGLQADRI